MGDPPNATPHLQSALSGRRQDITIACVILALRHPCDVVLSCFMSNFGLNPAMANFLRLEDASSRYDLSFTHWNKAHELLPDGVIQCDTNASTGENKEGAGKPRPFMHLT